MPYQIISEKRGLYFKLEGLITFKDIRRAAADGWEHENNYINIFQIWDFTDVMSFEMDHLEAVLAARMDNIAFANIGNFTKIAIVTKRQDVFERYAIYRKYIDGSWLAIDIFNDELDAREWIAKRDDHKYYAGLEFHS